MKSHLQASVRRIARRFLVMVLVLATTLSSMSGSAHARFISPDD